MDYAACILKSLGWDIQQDVFDCIDWEHGPVHLQAGGHSFPAYVSPYSLGCEVTAELVVAATLNNIRKASGTSAW
ncbi:MAG: hypothetical protein SCK57_13520 [Bacillota bacterium]|nr:hypothetical protein [Bacillota bacterium]MDW7678673.1 hypothetical protein [Bacillota bacterium]